MVPRFGHPSTRDGSIGGPRNRCYMADRNTTRPVADVAITTTDHVPVYEDRNAQKSLGDLVKDAVNGAVGRNPGHLDKITISFSE